ncbi:MAG: amino acid permease [Thermoanaerobaculia bacterium]
MTESEGPKLRRALGLSDCVLYVVGSIVGTGIFLSVGQIARKVPSPGWILLAWLLGGLHALAAGFTYAELGTRRPEAGGAYVFLSETFGRLPAFLFNWAMSFVIMPASVAALAVGFAEYLGAFFPELGTARHAFDLPFHIAVSQGQLVAIAMALLLTIWNCIGIKEGGLLNDGLTLLKIASVLALIFFGLTAARAHVPSLALTAPSGASPGFLLSFGGALAGVLWSYDGWINIAALGGEVKNPKRDIPGGLVLGVLIVIGLYLATNLVYLMALPVSALGATPRAAESVVHALFGSGAARWITAAVLVSVLGSLSANIIPGPRISYATAKDGLLPRPFARLHPEHETPAFGLMFQGLLGAAMVLTGSFDQLVEMIAFAGTLFYALGGASIFVYRKRNPEAPYLCPGYPYVPIVYVAASVLFALAILVDAPVAAAKGTAILALGAVVYLLKSRGRAQATGP